MLASTNILNVLLILLFVAAISLPIVFRARLMKGEKRDISLIFGLIKITQSRSSK